MPEYNLVEQHWPFDGPHTPHTVRTAASALSDLVRYLNNATGPTNTGTLENASDVDHIIGHIQAVAGLLPQLLGQLAEFVTQQSLADALYDNRDDGDPKLARTTAAELLGAMRQMRYAFDSAYSYTGNARRCSSRLGNRETPVRQAARQDEQPPQRWEIGGFGGRPW